MDSRLPPLLQATSGAIGSMVGNAIVFPLDLVTTRVQHAPKQSNARKASILTTLLHLIHRRGVARMYSGLKADTVSTLLSSFLYFLIYSALHKVAARHAWRLDKMSKSSEAVKELLIGLIAGIASKGVTLPISAVCVRQQLSDKDSMSLVASIKAVQRERGLLGLFSALPASIPLALLPSLTLYIHSILLRLLVPASQRAHPKSAVTFVLGAASNAIATLPLYPLILIKTRNQSGSDGGAVGIVHDEGVSGLYKGLEGQLLKGVVQQGVMMMIKQRVEEGIVQAYRSIAK